MSTDLSNDEWSEYCALWLTCERFWSNAEWLDVEPYASGDRGSVTPRGWVGPAGCAGASGTIEVAR